MLMYWSSSKEKYVAVAEMAVPHLHNAVRKLEAGDPSALAGHILEEGSPTLNLTAAEMIAKLRAEIERRGVEQHEAAHEQNRERGESVAGFIAALVVALAVIVVACMFLFPLYSVWQQGQQGQAKLARAEQERRILVTQAQAEKDAAQLRADAIGIVGQAAKDFPEYREQEFMASFGEALREGHISQIIYVPTEANIPILEARGK